MYVFTYEDEAGGILTNDSDDEVDMRRLSHRVKVLKDLVGSFQERVEASRDRIEDLIGKFQALGTKMPFS